MGSLEPENEKSLCIVQDTIDYDAIEAKIMQRKQEIVLLKPESKPESKQEIKLSKYKIILKNQ